MHLFHLILAEQHSSIVHSLNIYSTLGKREALISSVALLPSTFVVDVGIRGV
jgi:hypothetical protein